MEADVMARPKPGAKGEGKPAPEGKSIAFRASAEYAAWVEKLAAVNRSTVAGLIDQALVRHANAIGFPEAPPER